MTRDPIKGDRVIYYGRKAVVKLAYYTGSGDRICELEYEDNDSPYFEEVTSDSLIIIEDLPPPVPSQKYRRKTWIDSTKMCPVCETKWTVTKFGNKTWYDCSKCKLTKEQIMKD
jgi:hypothetical protein